ncbi:hypothetical protein ACVW2L_003617 [Mucilaginibacter sp. HD30]
MYIIKLKLAMVAVMVLLLPKLSHAQTRDTSNRQRRINLAFAKMRQQSKFVTNDSIILTEAPIRRKTDSLIQLNLYRLAHPVRGARLKAADTLFKRRVQQ